MIESDALDQMDTSDVQDEINEKFGDGGLLYSDIYDLSEVVVSTDETVVWFPETKPIEPFGEEIATLPHAEQIRVVTRDVDGPEGENVTQRVFELSTEEGDTVQPLAKQRVDPLSDIVGLEPDELLKHARIHPEQHPYPVIFELQEGLGRVLILPVDLEEEGNLDAARSRAESDPEELNATEDNTNTDRAINIRDSLNQSEREVVENDSEETQTEGEEEFIDV